MKNVSQGGASKTSFSFFITTGSQLPLDVQGKPVDTSDDFDNSVSQLHSRRLIAIAIPCLMFSVAALFCSIKAFGLSRVGPVPGGQRVIPPARFILKPVCGRHELNVTRAMQTFSSLFPEEASIIEENRARIFDDINALTYPAEQSSSHLQPFAYQVNEKILRRRLNSQRNGSAALTALQHVGNALQHVGSAAERMFTICETEIAYVSWRVYVVLSELGVVPGRFPLSASKYGYGFKDSLFMNFFRGVRRWWRRLTSKNKYAIEVLLQDFRKAKRSWGKSRRFIELVAGLWDLSWGRVVIQAQRSVMTRLDWVVTGVLFCAQFAAWFLSASFHYYVKVARVIARCTKLSVSVVSFLACLGAPLDGLAPINARLSDVAGE